jgi:hypothetical protein
MVGRGYSGFSFCDVLQNIEIINQLLLSLMAIAWTQR